MHRYAQKCGTVLIIAAGLSAVAGQAWAAGSFEFTRETYDLIMRYVNFAILAGLIIKYARRPIISFLKDKRAEVRQTIQDLEEKKRAIEKRIEETQRELEAGQDRLALIKKRIVADGKRRKEELIAGAKEESSVLIQSAKHSIDAIIRDAGVRIRSDLVDMAADIALEKIPTIITAQDHERFVQNWLNSANR